VSPVGDHRMRPLELDDIVDLRAYERVREEYRRRIIELKRRRRVALGPVVSLVFESPETVRFQVQEMARAERITTDEGILGELEVYNRLLPGGGELSATMFIELTSESELRDWLPRLVGIETAIGIELAPGEVVESEPESSHALALTRDEVTPAVHYIRFAFAEDQASRLAAGPAALVARHPEYEFRAPLGADTLAELAADLSDPAALAPLG
jgi:Protein of unknown function (DUF3501)